MTLATGRGTVQNYSFALSQQEPKRPRSWRDTPPCCSFEPALRVARVRRPLQGLPIVVGPRQIRNLVERHEFFKIGTLFHNVDITLVVLVLASRESVSGVDECLEFRRCKVIDVPGFRALQQLTLEV